MPKIQKLFMETFDLQHFSFIDKYQFLNAD